MDLLTANHYVESCTGSMDRDANSTERRICIQQVASVALSSLDVARSSPSHDPIGRLDLVPHGVQLSVRSMNRRDLVLAVLAASQGRSLTPVQMQKAAFLVTTNIPQVVTEGPLFNFVPYDYGPFDKDVYAEAHALAACGEAVVAPSAQGRWNTYAASAQGLQRGQQILAGLAPPQRKYVEDVALWVLSQSFGSLVKSIYSAYPAMKQNSIFQG
jgi:hypothetical protein